MSPATTSHAQPKSAARPTTDETAKEETGAGEEAGAGKAPGAGKAEAARETAEGQVTADAAAVPRGWRDRRPTLARSLTRATSWATTVLAAALVLGALLLPTKVTHLAPQAFARIPVEGLLGVAALLAMRPRTRRVAAALAGGTLGLLTIVKMLDMGSYSTLDRPFDLVLDWVLLDDARDFLRESVGPAGATGAIVGVVLLVVALLFLTPLAVIRLSRLIAAHRSGATRTTLVLGTVWVTCATLGIEIAGAPVASVSSAKIVRNRAYQVATSLEHERTFAKKATIDAFRHTPPSQLLTGLRGKNVIFTFVESYGRDAVQDPRMAPHVNAVLEEGTRRLRDAGFSSRSAFLTSPVTGARSWLAHSTFLSGLWIKNQQRYRSLTSSDRLTLTGAFRRTNAWRTVGIVPGVRRAWPEGEFFRLDHIYDSRQLGYKGPNFSWTPVPDQYSLSAFERLEHGKRDELRPLMTEIILASSHNPWAPIPRMLDWDEIGDGSIYHAIKREGKDPKKVWTDPAQVRTEYRRAIQYSLTSLISYVEKYGDEDTVLVFLGDHQPVPTVVGHRASRDVPISIVAHDPKVMERISGWGWQNGLKPASNAPVWRMDAFRDRFLTAYGPRPGSPPPPPIR